MGGGGGGGACSAYLSVKVRKSKSNVNSIPHSAGLIKRQGPYHPPLLSLLSPSGGSLGGLPEAPPPAQEGQFQKGHRGHSSRHMALGVALSVSAPASLPPLGSDEGRGAMPGFCLGEPGPGEGGVRGGGGGGRLLAVQTVSKRKPELGEGGLTLPSAPPPTVGRRESSASWRAARSGGGGPRRASGPRKTWREPGQKDSSGRAPLAWICFLTRIEGRVYPIPTQRAPY